MNKIPVLNPHNIHFDYELVSAFKNIGFAAIENVYQGNYSDNLVSSDVLSLALSAAQSFFNTDNGHKSLYTRQGLNGQRGYTPFGVEKAKDQTQPDLKEFLQFGFSDNYCPYNLAKLHFEVFSKLYTQMDVLARALINDLDFELGLQLHSKIGREEERQSVLRVIHYPPTGSNPKGERSAAHEDINLLTILPAASAAGLQVKNREGVWIDAPTDPDLLIVNVGDLLQEYTNGLLKSTTHRVINTKEGETQSRYSFPFFMHPKADMRLSERYTAGEYLEERLIEIGLKK